MMRIPKYTAGMFKKHNPRYGASGIRMPRLPRPKKFAEGGSTEEMENEKKVAEFLNQPPSGPAAKPKPKKKAPKPDSSSDDLINRGGLPDQSVVPPTRKAKGGSIKSSCCRGDGIAERGKTKGKFV